MKSCGYIWKEDKIWKINVVNIKGNTICMYAVPQLFSKD
ncbi:hypothetical protein LCGC14_1267560 [marine sediment metagenome]|uniref:Uncharacterized protein n=1 Tax=marine sediment metagenome TaxID=412755 RepID=A0A0F9LJX0_9ZZZZ